MATKRINFTDKRLCSLKLPDGVKRKYYRDTKSANLFLSVTDKGTKSFLVYKKFQGRPLKVTIGKYPEIPIEYARKKSMEILLQMYEGKNPNIEKKKLSNTISFGYLYEKYMKDYSKKSKKSWKEDQSLITNIIPHWFNRKITDISNPEVRNLHKRIGQERGRCCANRFLSCLRGIYNRGIEWGLECKNPAIGIKPFPEKSRSRFLLPEEISNFIDALLVEQNEIIRDFFFLALLTGARKANLMAMQWKDIDWNLKVWIIPETKNGDSLIIPLTKEAIEILQIREKNNPCLGFLRSKYVFPGHGKNKHLTDPKKVWGKLLKRAGIKDLRIHDLRRTFGSWQASTGANSYVIGKSLGHKSQQSTAIYARLSIGPVRESIEKATTAMFATTNSRFNKFIKNQT